LGCKDIYFYNISYTLTAFFSNFSIHILLQLSCVILHGF
jgi:hypothetical protein